MTNQEWLATISPDEWMKTIDWLFHDYGKRWNNSYLAIKDWLTEEKKAEKSELEKIQRIRFETGCPYWAIKKCLELEHGCEEKAIKKLEKIYAWYYNLGDNPDLYVKRKEEALHAETIAEPKTDLEKAD